MKPVNISPVMAVMFRCLPKINEVLSNKQVTVEEAIDIAAKIAKETAKEAGVADKVIAVTD